MKKLLLPILVLLLCGFVVYYFVLYKDNDNYPDFNYKFSKLSKIHIVNEKGISVKLNKVNNQWLVDSIYEVNTELLTNLKEAVENQIVLGPVSAGEKERIWKNILVQHKKVELFDENNNIVLSFFVGGPNSDHTGTFMARANSEDLYMVGTEKRDKFFMPVYITEIEKWKSLWLINEKAEQIKSVKVQYIDTPQYSFMIENKNPVLTITGSPAINAAANQNKLQSYLSFFEKKSCMGHENNYIYKDSIMKEKNKFVSLELVLKDGRIKQFDIFFMPMNYRSKNKTDENIEGKKDSDYLFVYNKIENDFVLIQKIQFQSIFLRYKDFYFN